MTGELPALLKANALRKCYGATIAIDNISLEVPSGSVIAIMGPSGCGKSTLLRCLSLAEVPDSGDLTFLGNRRGFPNPHSENPGWKYPAITQVFQQLFLWPHLSIRRNITIASHLTPFSIDNNELVTRFGLCSLLDRYPNETSVGERQRAALVRALLLKPKLLLLDEVTSALDIHYAQLVGETLRAFVQEGGSVVLVTHQLGFARKFADRYVFIDSGQVVASGPMKKLDEDAHSTVRRILSVI